MWWLNTDPKASRSSFRTRDLEDLFVAGGLFLILVALFSWVISLTAPALLWMLLSDALAGVASYYLYLHLHSSPIRLQCEGCGAVITSDTPWICGNCGEENLDTEKFPFINRCAKCTAPPKSYKCHHCGELIFLSADEDLGNPALRFESEVPGAREKLKTATKRASEREEMEHSIAMAKSDLVEAELNERLQAFKKRAEFEKKSGLEKKQQSLDTYLDDTIGIEEVARQQKAKHAEMFKDNQRERKRRDRVVDAWMQREGPQP